MNSDQCSRNPSYPLSLSLSLSESGTPGQLKMPEKKLEEARRLKSLAEAKCKSSNFKSAAKYAKRAQGLNPNLDGISSMVTALKILRTASKNNPNPNWYKILDVEPFAHTNTIKKNYKKLAFLLHPDKNPDAAGSEEAFKLVNEAFRFLSDQVRRKEYDMRLRIKIQDEKIKENSADGVGIGVLERDTFWTACSTCRLLHQFERRYLGQNLVCPSCRKSFKALEVESGENGENCENAKVRTSERLKRRRDVGLGSEKGKMEMGSEGLGGSSSRVEMNGGGEARLRRRMSSVGEVMERCKPPGEAKTGEELMTLAELQAELKKKKAVEEKKKMSMKLKLKVKDNKKDEGEKRVNKRERLRRNELNNGKSLKVGRSPVSKKIKDLGSDKNGDSEIMMVEDSDFYNFDKDRVGRSFKKGQVWAVYDDDDGMPRHYGLIDEVVSVNPFEVKISWLDLENNGDEWMASPSREKMGFHVTCGRFKVSRKTYVNSVNIFSHVVDCERAAREIYRIYPNKGSVWALYNEEGLDAEGRNLSVDDNDKRCYDIVVFLTRYSEMQGLSMGYLEKVDGFKTVFKRREIGSHAIRWLQKNDVRLVSHQIPARKLTGDEAPSLSKECWELDPASLPPELLTFGWGR